MLRVTFREVNGLLIRLFYLRLRYRHIVHFKHLIRLILDIQNIVTILKNRIAISNASADCCLLFASFTQLTRWLDPKFSIWEHNK